MSEALKNRNDQLEVLITNISDLSEKWLNSNGENSLTSITLNTREDGVRLLRGYVQDENPVDTFSLKYNAFVGIAFFENHILSEIHYPFSNEIITSFTSIDLNTWVVTGHDLKDDSLVGGPVKYQSLDSSEQLNKLSEFANYFKRLTSFAIPYETKYLDDINRQKRFKGLLWEVFPIRPYVFETVVLK